MSKHNRDRRARGAAKHAVDVGLHSSGYRDDYDRATAANARDRDRRYPRPPSYRDQDEAYDAGRHGVVRPLFGNADKAGGMPADVTLG